VEDFASFHGEKPTALLSFSNVIEQRKEKKNNAKTIKRK
jgi:hypothetical protein